MSVELIEAAARALGPELLDEVAFLGAAAMPLWTEPAAPPWRPTNDVDVVVEVVSLIDYYRLGDRLKSHGFQEDPHAREICAWRHAPSDLRIDVMPTEAAILGFTNRWYGEALRTAVAVELPSGIVIRAVAPPYLLATKIEAFKGRGKAADGELDYLGSRDFGDIVALIDGRAELVDEVAAADGPLREYIKVELTRMREHFRFDGGVSAHLLPDWASQARSTLVVERVERMSGAG